MKTLIHTTISKLMLALILSTGFFMTTAAVAASPSPILKIKEAKDFSKIVVSGNVEINLRQGSKESISYSDDNAGYAYVTQKGETLKVTNSGKDKVVLNITVKNIYRLEAKDEAIIRTSNTLNVKYLQLFLKGDAKAEITSNTSSLYTVLNDNADLKLSGSTDDHSIIIHKFPVLTLDKLVAKNTNIESNEVLAKL